MNKKQLLQWIDQVSFAVIEITLYLDTHPDDKEALAFFDKYIEERRRAVGIYCKQYGPLVIDCIDNSNPWCWATDPMPWEGVC